LDKQCLLDAGFPIEKFVEHLIGNANYGIKGEKPLAMIAALQYVPEADWLDRLF